MADAQEAMEQKKAKTNIASLHIPLEYKYFKIKGILCPKSTGRLDVQEK